MNEGEIEGKIINYLAGRDGASSDAMTITTMLNRSNKGAKLGHAAVIAKCRLMAMQGKLRESNSQNKSKFYVATQEQIESENRLKEKLDIDAARSRRVYVPDAKMKYAMERTRKAREGNSIA